MGIIVTWSRCLNSESSVNIGSGGSSVSSANCVNSVNIVSDCDGDDTFISDGVFYQFQESPKNDRYGRIHIDQPIVTEVTKVTMIMDTASKYLCNLKKLP